MSIIIVILLYFFRFALPIFISQVFQQLYNTADSLIVGHWLGTGPLAAVSSSGTLIFMLVSFFEGLFMGAGVLISRCFGEKDEEGVSRAIHTDFAIGLVSGVFLTVAGVLFTPTFLRWMNTDPAVLPLAIEYFRWYFAGSLALVLYNVCRGIMTAVGDSKRPLIYLIVSSVLNILLDLLFVGVFRFGVWSAALATVISQAVSVVLCMIHLLKKGARFGILAAVILAEIVGILYYLLSPGAVALFEKNPEVILLGVRQARTVTLFYFLLAYSHSIAAVCRGAGKAFVPMAIMLSVWCVFRICYIFTVMHFFRDISYIYWAYPLTWAISSVIYLLYYLKSDWVHGFER